MDAINGSAIHQLARRRRSPLKAKRVAIVCCDEDGGRTWARTKDPLIKSQLLYQLSYASVTG
jgi:hypothetical protein